MGRKAQSEAERLRLEAEHLLKQQRDVINHAGAVIRDASRELGRYARDEAIPRASRSARSSLASGQRHLVNDVLPSVFDAVGSAMSAVDAARLGGKRVAREAMRRAAPVGTAVRAGGAGKFVALGIGIAVLAGIGYVVWQNLRADDEMWIDDEG